MEFQLPKVGALILITNTGDEELVPYIGQVGICQEENSCPWVRFGDGNEVAVNIQYEVEGVVIELLNDEDNALINETLQRILALKP